MFEEIFDNIEKLVEITKIPLYFGGLALLYLLYILMYFGLIKYNISYIENIHIIIQIYICIFLMIRFHPFRKHQLKEYDAQIIFGSALFLMTSLGFTNIFMNYFQYVSPFGNTTIE